jgi:hypothetical protein
MRKKRQRNREPKEKGDAVTVETKTTIEPSDVSTVEFECIHCHSITSWPLAIAKNPPTSCPCEQKGQWMTVGGDTYRNIVSLIALLQQFSKTQNEPFILRFGVKNGVSDPASSDGD